MTPLHLAADVIAALNLLLATGWLVKAVAAIRGVPTLPDLTLRAMPLPNLDATLGAGCHSRRSGLQRRASDRGHAALSAWLGRSASGNHRCRRPLHGSLWLAHGSSGRPGTPGRLAPHARSDPQPRSAWRMDRQAARARPPSGQIAPGLPGSCSAMGICNSIRVPSPSG
jgi:hypothetical protein